MVFRFIIFGFLVTSTLCSVKSFDDSIVFRLDWPGDVSTPNDLLEKFQKKSLGSDEAVVVSSIDNEKYICSLPKESSDSKKKNVEYFGPSPYQLIKPLYDQRSCTYRIEIYWTYELCHGHYVLQYHEEKDGHRRTSRQEYYLGQYIADLDVEDKNIDYANPPKRKIEDQMLPYYAVRYSQGTVCDISQKPRISEVHYVCDPDGKNQVYSVDEVASCEYEIVVLTPKLCHHPGFKVEKHSENPLECYPLEGSPSKPTSLTVWEQELHWEERATQKNLILPSIPIDRSSKARKIDHSAESAVETPGAGRPTSDASLEQSFLNGEYCLYGGVGWWKHEYCHTKQVLQYHEDPDTGGRAEVLLGAWHPDEHLRWIEKRPHKKPVKINSRVVQVSHFYSGGDVCDVTGQPRTVEVRVKCKHNPMTPDAVTLYLLEPKSCEYILGVESHMFCEILQTVDANGMFKIDNNADKATKP